MGADFHRKLYKIRNRFRGTECEKYLRDPDQTRRCSKRLLPLLLGVSPGWKSGENQPAAGRNSGPSGCRPGSGYISWRCLRAQLEYAIRARSTIPSNIGIRESAGKGCWMSDRLCSQRCGRNRDAEEVAGGAFSPTCTEPDEDCPVIAPTLTTLSATSLTR